MDKANRLKFMGAVEIINNLVWTDVPCLLYANKGQESTCRTTTEPPTIVSFDMETFDWLNCVPCFRIKNSLHGRTRQPLFGPFRPKTPLQLSALKVQSLDSSHGKSIHCH